MSSDAVSTAAPVVIVGSGLAGYAVAREFRKLDKETPLIVLSRDHAGFYSKPMLSNALAGNKTAASLLMKTADKMATELNASVRAGVSLQGLDTAERRLTLTDGAVLNYRDLVLALGADPIRLPLAGDAADTVLSVNDLDDYARFADALEGARSVAILGGGLIGCEFANDLLHRGIVPIVLDVADRPLSRLLPAEGSAWLRARLEAAGVTFRLGVAASRVDRVEDGGVRLALSDGSSLRADRVLSAIGLRPRVAIAEAAGLAIGRGITTDRLLATSAPHVYAVGDCAEVAGLNLPYVMPLMQQSRALAATLCGQSTPVVYPAMPVLVKTPACPTVVCPPPPEATGEWNVASTDEACEARYVDPDGRLLGFALLGTATSKRQALAAEVPAWFTD
ncbi:MAG: FAD-dependent oxidoreductase [Burkholderiaceae bacterium]|nr:FAD-dependent oxidoreductase [Burkholderiaceae bacterium]